MVDGGLFINSLLIATPIAGMTVLVGAWGMATLRRSREHEIESHVRREIESEKRRYEHQRELETLRFECDQRRSRDELSRKTALVMLNERINAYGQVWKIVAGIPISKEAVTIDTVKEMALKVRSWRFNKGGLLADELTREAILGLQRALGEYDGSDQAFSLIRRARRVMRLALRAELGLGEQREEGNSPVNYREVIKSELAEISRVLVRGAETGELVG